MGLRMRVTAPCLAVLISMGCGGPGSSDGGTDAETATEVGPDSEAGDPSSGGTNLSTDPATSRGTGGASSIGSSAGETGESTTNDSTEGGTSDCDFSEDFEGLANGDPWPEVWVPVGGVALADVQDGWGRLRPMLSDYSLARMTAFIDCPEIDTSLTFMFTDGSTQGIGFYARHNGGHLRETNPTGEGYAAFAEAFRNPTGLGAWREVDGQEQPINGAESFEILPNVEYRLRFRLTQSDAATSLLQGKIWQVGDSEPEAWTVERTDDTASLQGVGGALAVDAWVTGAAGQGNEGADLLVDDIVSTAAR